MSLDSLEMSNITYINGADVIMHWIRQKKRNGVDLCGDLLIINSYFHNIETNIFTIDLLLDPSQIQFILDVDTSVFTDINGIIFNFNHNNDILQPIYTRIQQQNTFINIKNSHFENNGRKKENIQVWSPNDNRYVYDTNFIQNGTIILHIMQHYMVQYFFGIVHDIYNG
eukprot:65020_1